MGFFLSNYQIDIINRKGNLHTNVDVLSRPVFLVPPQIDASKSIEPDSTDKQLDVYEDEALKQFLTTGKHIAGRSKRNCKRIEKLAKVFKYENGTFLLQKDDRVLHVPPPEERPEIVRKAHLIGHFQVHTTLKRIQEKYFWPKMIELIIQIKAACMVCQQFERARIYDHPARALPILGLFDRVGIDLVFGLPLTLEGFKGILLITDYLCLLHQIKTSN